MKQFNLEEYLKNPERKIVTRDGRKVTRFLCTDAKTDFPIIALVEATPGSTNECLRTFKRNGRYFGIESSPCDLFFAPEKHEGWINIYFGKDGPISGNIIFNSKEEAEESGRHCCGFTKDLYITSIKIEWED